jgi:hypothetical protein
MRETSREAFEGIRENGTEAALRSRVLAFLKSRGTRGATDREIEFALRVPPRANVRTRRKTLQREGLVRDSGETRRPVVDGQKLGRRATVWVFDPHEPAVEERKTRCPICNGSGKVRERRTNKDGQFTLFA